MSEGDKHANNIWQNVCLSPESKGVACSKKVDINAGGPLLRSQKEMECQPTSVNARELLMVTYILFGLPSVTDLVHYQIEHCFTYLWFKIIRIRK